MKAVAYLLGPGRVIVRPANDPDVPKDFYASTYVDSGMVDDWKIVVALGESQMLGHYTILGRTLVELKRCTKCKGLRARLQKDWFNPDGTEHQHPKA